MSCVQYRIYQCENPACGLRFPGTDGYPRWNRCPACRSNLTFVSICNKREENDAKFSVKWKMPIEVLLDNIRSALNVGSILRTANGTGIQNIYCCGITPTPDNLKVKKTSLGAENSVNWVYSPNGLTQASGLKSKGYILWALEESPIAESLYHVQFPKTGGPIILIAGNEVYGVDPEILGICERLIAIPMMGMKRSYNVAIAFSIAASFLFYRFLSKANS